MKILKDRLQFAITLALFFPVVLESLFRLGTDPIEPETMTLRWGLVIAALILSYFVIEIKEFKIHERLAVYLDKFLLLEIFIFSLLCFIFASLAQNGYLSVLYTWIFKISLLGVIFIPITFFIILVGNMGFRMCESILHNK